jgi:hypothetical protein
MGRRSKPPSVFTYVITLTKDPDLEPIARFVAGKSCEQIQALRDRILNEIEQLEAHFPFREPLDDPGRFALQRDRLTCARRRREIDYLNEMLEQHRT